MKLNCDIGEKVHDNDALIMPYIDQANIACGFHASDPITIVNTIKLAVKHDVEIGAHPSYPDQANFGRQSMAFPKDELIAIIHYQVGALQTLCQLHGAQLRYVKPHGALYNDMMADTSLFELVCQAISAVNGHLSLMLQALPNTSEFRTIANKWKVSLQFEAFADRAYQANGLLVPRSQKGAVIHNESQVLDQINDLLKKQILIAIDGTHLPLHVDTLCVHGDNTAALKLVSSLRKLIDESN